MARSNTAPTSTSATNTAISHFNKPLYAFIIPSVLTVIMSLLVGGLLEYRANQYQQDSIHQQVEHVFSATRERITEVGANEELLSNIPNEVSRISSKLHITLVSADGKIIASSTLSSAAIATLPDIANSNDIIQAAKLDTGTALYIDNINHEPSMIFTQRAASAHFDGFIRVDILLEDYEGAGLALRPIVFSAVVISWFFLICWISWFLMFLKKSTTQERALLASRVEASTKDIMLLHRLTNMLAASQSLSEVQKVVEDIVPRIIGDINCSVSLMNPARNLVERKIDWGGEWPGVKVFSPNDCWALRKGKHHFSHDQYSSQACHHMTGCSENTICIPLLAHGNAIGLLHMIVGDKLNESDHDLAFTIAEHLGLALANLEMQEKLRQQATRDALTGLFNRRFFEETMDTEISRAQRHNEPFGLLMLDIDHFKQFNDNFGHDAGDYVLKSMGDLIRKSIRSEDSACRLGGEEIAVILPKANLNEAINCAEKLCQSIAQKPFQLHSTALGTVTVSIGIALYPMHAESAEALVKAADVALYLAKDNGRNRCEVSELNSQNTGKHVRQLRADIVAHSEENTQQEEQP